jgi:hypothetical protein
VEPTLDETELVFSIVFTPGTFQWLRPFTLSLIERTQVRLRLVANGCPPDELRTLVEFSHGHGGRIEEVFQVSGGELVPHGTALDEVYRERTDGTWFCFMDSDVKARGPLLEACAPLMPTSVALTSGSPSWASPRVAPRGTHILPGNLLFDEDGFTYGSSYVALYDRGALERVRDRWNVGFEGYRWPDLPVEARRDLERFGRRFDVYDTAKVVNILLQTDGGSVCHFEHPNLVHIGGMSVQYLCEAFDVRPIDLWDAWERSVEPAATAAEVQEHRGRHADRPNPARLAALALRCLVRGEELPPIPTALSSAAAERLRVVLDELADLVDRYAGNEDSGQLSVPPG